MTTMLRSLAIALLMATFASANPFAAKQTPSDSKSAYMSNLMNHAVRVPIPTANSMKNPVHDVHDVHHHPSITAGTFLQFVKCQFVKTYSYSHSHSHSHSQEDDNNNKLVTQQFVIFRLCQSSSCGSCDAINTSSTSSSTSSSSISSIYGEYVIKLNDYLDITVAYHQEEQKQMCETCFESCSYYYYNYDDLEEAEDDGGRRRLKSDVNVDVNFNVHFDFDCDFCVTKCQKIEAMEENFYLDATKFIKCQQVQVNNDNNSYEPLYTGPICASQGSKIKIGIFTDEECTYLDSSKDVENYLMDENGYGYKVSHALLRKVYDQSQCIDCLVNKDHGNDNNNNDHDKDDETKEVCANLYHIAAKCDKTKI